MVSIESAVTSPLPGRASVQPMESAPPVNGSLPDASIHELHGASPAEPLFLKNEAPRILSYAPAASTVTGALKEGLSATFARWKENLIFDLRVAPLATLGCYAGGLGMATGFSTALVGLAAGNIGNGVPAAAGILVGCLSGVMALGSAGSRSVAMREAIERGEVPGGAVLGPSETK